MFKYLTLLLSFSFFLNASQFEGSRHCKFVNEQIEIRWQDFSQGRDFKLFEPGRSDEALLEEYEKLDEIRKHVWITNGYELAENLFTNDLIRAPGCVAFAYNNTIPYYNASTLYQGNKNLIACEGPRSKDIPKFFNLIAEHGVTHLIRLTDAYEGEAKKCHPYWEGLLRDYFDREGYLDIPFNGGIYSIQAYDMAYWRDMKGVDPELLLTFVLRIREELRKDPNSLFIIHCSAGVGRTGTFIASLAIVDAIDLGEPFSIEEIVYRLSLQRVQCVSRSGQYSTLYRLAECYLNQIR